MMRGGFVSESTPLRLSPCDYGFIAGVARKLWGWDTITITGGEPLISPIYRETCEEIAKAKVKITTVTNGSLISSPKKILANNSQLNISLHTMAPIIYRKITGSAYPHRRIIDTIIAVRTRFPEMSIHLNAVVIRGLNDNTQDMERLIEFANIIGGMAKFIDLVSDDPSLVVSFAEITEKLASLGFKKTDENAWQTFFSRGG